MSEKIICPYCEVEYLPGEIYLPKHFLGQPKDIDKDITGAVLLADGIPQNLKETYTCDKCQKTFTVTAKIDYTTTPANNDLEYVSTKYDYNRLFLDEE